MPALMEPGHVEYSGRREALIPVCGPAGIVNHGVFLLLHLCLKFGGVFVFAGCVRGR